MANEPLKPPGWHSRKHQSREAQDKAREDWKAKHSKESKRIAAELRNEDTSVERTRQYRRDQADPAKQLLQEVFGNGEK